MKNNPANALINETSPYLQQHAHNPVNWYPWGKEALQKIATVLKTNNDVEIDVRTNLGTEYYSGSATVNSWSGNETRSDMNTQKNDMNTTEKNVDTKVKTETSANIGDSGYVGSGTVTKSKTTQDGNKK